MMLLKIQIKVEANLSFSDEVQLSSEAMGVYELQVRLQEKSLSVTSGGGGVDSYTHFSATQ